MVLDVDAVLFREALHEVARHPHLVGGLLGPLAEDLELPLALGHLCVDALVVDAGVQAQVEVFVDDLASYVADIRVTHTRVVGTLRGRVSGIGEAEGPAVLVEEVFLLEPEPCPFVVEDGGALVRRMRGLAVGHHDFAHHDDAVLAGAVRENADRLQHAVRIAALGLQGRTSIEPPHGQFLQLGELTEIFDLSLPAEVGDRSIPVKPEIF